MEKNLKFLWWIPVLLILLWMFSSTFRTVESGFVWVKYTLGKISHEELKPGFHIITPIINRMELVNVRVKTLNYKAFGSTRNVDVQESSSEWIKNKDQISVLDRRWLPISIEMTILYQLNADEAAETIEKYGYTWDEKLVNPTVREVVRDILWEYEAEIIPEKRIEIANKIKVSIQEKFKNTIVNVADVQLRHIELPAQVQDKILQVQIAKQEVQRQQYELEKAGVEAQTIKVQATAKADAEIEKAKWKAEAIKLEAVAQAEANKEISASITAPLIQYKYINNWNGELPKVFGGDGNIFQLPSSLIGK